MIQFAFFRKSPPASKGEGGGRSMVLFYEVANLPRPSGFLQVMA